LLANNEHRKALDCLKELNLNSEAADSALVALFSRLQDVERKNILGTISEDNYQREVHKLRQNILDFLQQYVPIQERTKASSNHAPTTLIGGAAQSFAGSARQINYILAALVLILGAILLGREVGPAMAKGPASFSVLVHGQGGKEDLILQSHGMIELYTENLSMRVDIGAKGAAHFSEVPPSLLSEGNGIKLRLKGLPKSFSIVNRDSVYSLEEGMVIALELEIEGMDGLTGLVKDAQTGLPLAGVKAQVGEFVDYSDSSGVFSISIPQQAQNRVQIIRFSKIGFKENEVEDDKLNGNQHLIVSMKRG